MDIVLVHDCGEPCPLRSFALRTCRFVVCVSQVIGIRLGL